MLVSIQCLAGTNVLYKAQDIGYSIKDNHSLAKGSLILLRIYNIGFLDKSLCYTSIIKIKD